MTSHMLYRFISALLGSALLLSACGSDSAAQSSPSAVPEAQTTGAPTVGAPTAASDQPTAAPTIADATSAATTIPAATSAPAATAQTDEQQPLPMQTVQVEGLPGALTLPTGFAINVFAKDLPDKPRFMAFDPNGVLYVSIPQANQVVALPDANNDGVADEVRVAADKLNKPHGLVFHDGALWVANTDAVLRLTEPDAQGLYQQRQTVIGDLPANGQHSTRTIGFGPDGQLYVAAGSDCNVCIEKDPRRAAITRYAPDGSSPQPFAIGLRNPVGFVWNDQGELVATNNGRDNLGDDVPPETINITKGGEDFGWPRCHAGDIVDPDYGGGQGCTGVTAPAFKIQAHSAPLGLRFYTGEQFPEAYRGDLFVALHGSWNRTTPTGYKVVRLQIENNRPTAIEDFISGWQQGNDSWGRPVDIIVGPDGSMFISDDGLGAIYRITYTGTAAVATLPASAAATSAPAAGAAATPAGTGLKIGTSSTRLQFQPASAALSAGQATQLIFDNQSTLQHNWVLVAQGQEQQVDTAAAAHNGDVTGIDGVLAASPILNSGAATIDLPALQPGMYRYICTVPGHFQAGMRGSLAVQ